MNFIFDNLMALLVSGTLAVMLLSQQTSTRQDMLERQSVYGAKVSAMTLAEWLEDDVVKLGARFGDARDRFTFTNTTRNGLLYTTRFEFYYNETVNSNETSDRVEVRYNIVRGDSVQVARAPNRYAPLYRLERFERSGLYLNGRWVNSSLRPVTEPTWVRTRGYGSPYGLSYFYLEPRDSNGAAITDPSRASEADYVRLQFSVIPTLFPVYRARFIREAGLNWASTVEIRPF